MPETQDLPAEEPQPKGTDRFFSQEEVNALIEKTRQQEKDKLYPQISKNDERWTALNEELKELRKFQKQAEKTEQERLAAIEAERKKREEAEMSAKELIEKRQAELAAQIAAMQQEHQSQLAVLQKENEYTRLQAYIQARINEERDNIAPQLIDLVNGDTPDEVEKSIEILRAKTEAIASDFATIATQRRAAMPGVAPAAGTNAAGPLDAPVEQQLTDQDIREMGMAQYAELRKKLGFGQQNQGLFPV